MNENVKLIIAIISAEDADQVQQNLNKEKFFSTRLSTKGGFLRKKNTTLIIGLKANLVNQALEIIKKYSRKKTQMIPNDILNEFGAYYSLPSEISIGGATIFVLDVEKFLKL
ncbi:cyclic-di-AMP receptor [Candidatus Phytoplasma melaleucae]|uniref:Cyclic-di-AMP receptor n=1 Tax=Candidatus Phytoplasma melaleucae TaxID=2982630 RepID=A0ABT9DEQ8_9MOLU|nr:cyclic-di-AMP receptor ['Melaleuca sp.' phytoplasma]MDO8168081.1 cyclic-di-AMP receptor ['Melaleuca sp.' phytoplasma]MDV3205362.1 cyclic-di-AMP receptor [Weeping tea tree witches'-broom phytoplasma]